MDPDMWYLTWAAAVAHYGTLTINWVRQERVRHEPFCWLAGVSAGRKGMIFWYRYTVYYKFHADGGLRRGRTAATSGSRSFVKTSPRSAGPHSHADADRRTAPCLRRQLYQRKGAGRPWQRSGRLGMYRP